MKKIEKIKERILSIVLTCAMMATLLVGIPPMEVHAAERPSDDELSKPITTLDVSLQVTDEGVECLGLGSAEDNYKLVYFYYPAVQEGGYEYMVEAFQSTIDNGTTMGDFKVNHTPEYDMIINDIPSNGVIDRYKDYNILLIASIYDYPMSSDGSTDYYCDKIAVFDISSNGNVSNGLSGGGTECDHDWEVLYDADDHYRKCVDCQQEADRAAHTFTNNVCSICGYEKKYTITIEYENFEGTENIDLRYMLYNTEADYVKTVSLDGQTSFEIPVGCTFNTFIYNDIDYDYTVTLKSGEADIVYDGWDRDNGNPVYVTVSLDSDITIILTKIVEGGGNENPPTTDTYDITLDRTNYAEGYVDLYTYDNEGSYVANTEDNNATITMPEGGKVRVFADSEFTVTAEGATISEMLSAGEEGYYYELTGIAADTTIVVNLKQNTPVVVAPAITSQPQNISVQEGQKATFTVTATGDNLSYQWQIDRNDGNGFVNLNGATSASYTTSTVDMDCNGFKYQCIVSNEGGSVTTNIATLTVTESTSVHTHSLTLVPEKAATCKEAGNKAYYTCSGCDSLFADATGTTITTAEAVKVAALDHDWTGEWTIIKEATETEDGKKETLCTRGCGHKKVAIIPATGTTDDNGNLEKDVEIAPDAPIDEVTLNNSKEELLEADNIFTDAEKTQIANGTDASVWIEISKTDESAIASTDKAKIEQEAAKIMGNNPTITYFDVDLFKQVGSGAKQEITEPGIAIKITITIPDELLTSDKTISREYKIIRLHEGQVDVINGTFDATTGEFTFETDSFSTYAIVYKDVPVNDDEENPTPGDDEENPTPGDDEENSTSKDADVTKPEDDKNDEVPKTGDSNTTLYSFMLMLLSGVGIIICSSKKELLNKES